MLSAGSNGSTETGQSKAKYIISIPPPSPRLPNAYTCCSRGEGGTNRCSDWNTECWSCRVKFEIYPMNNHVLTDYYSAGINSDMFNHILFTGTIICIALITVDILKREHVLTSESLNLKRGVWTFKSRCSLQQWSLYQIFRRIQINHQPDASIFQFIILTFIYSSTCFGRFLAHHQELNDCSGSLWFYLCIVVTVVLCSWSGRLENARNMLSCKQTSG